MVTALACGVSVASIFERCLAPEKVMTSAPSGPWAVFVVKPRDGTADTRHTASAPHLSVASPPWDCTECTPTPPSQVSAGVVGGAGGDVLGREVAGVRVGDGLGALVVAVAEPVGLGLRVAVGVGDVAPGSGCPLSKAI